MNVPRLRECDSLIGVIVHGSWLGRGCVMVHSSWLGPSASIVMIVYRSAKLKQEQKRTTERIGKGNSSAHASKMCILSLLLNDFVCLACIA
jgi:hypothetical protein